MNPDMPPVSDQHAIESVNILIFRMGGVRFGMDMDYVTGIRALGQLQGADITISYFHDFMNPPEKWDYKAPMVLALNGEKRRGIVIDGLEAVDVELLIDDIRPMPLLIREMAPKLPFWGVGLHGDELIMLVRTGG